MKSLKTLRILVLTGFLLIIAISVVAFSALTISGLASLIIITLLIIITTILILITFYISRINKILQHLDNVNIKLNQKMVELETEEEKNRVKILRSAIDGQDGERRRLSRELHDSVGQALIAIKLSLESSVHRSDSQMRATVDITKRMVDETIDEVRRVSNALLPAALDEFGIISALRSRCEEMARIAGMKITFISEGNLDHLDKKSKTYLYRIAQEGINNAIKHSHAKSLLVNLLRNDQKIDLTIADDGKGFTFVPDESRPHQGIQNMRERVSILHGSFSIESKPQQGTSLKISIPYISNYGKNKDNPG